MKNRKFASVILYIYFILIFIFVVIKFNGSFYDLSDRINSMRFNRTNGTWNINIIPFQSIKIQLVHFREWWAIKNILANIAVFVPIGFLLPNVYKKCASFFGTFVASFVLIVLIQLITMLGYFDIDDILINMLGSLIGYVLFCWFKMLSNISTILKEE